MNNRKIILMLILFLVLGGVVLFFVQSMKKSSTIPITEPEEEISEDALNLAMEIDSIQKRVEELNENADPGTNYISRFNSEGNLQIYHINEKGEEIPVVRGRR